MDKEPVKPKKENPFSGLLRLAEMPLTVAAMAGIIFKIFHLPAAGILMILSLSTLSVLYMFSAINITDDDALSGKDKIILKFNGIGSSVAVIGILFLLLRWPGSSLMILMSSGLLLATLFYMVNANSKSVETKPFDSKTIYRTSGIALLEILLFLIPQYHH
jgi:hypothetical protein